MNPDPDTNPAPETPTPLGELLIALESAECSCYSNPSGPCEYCRIIQKMQRVADKLQEPVPTVESAKVDAGWIIASHVTGEFVPVEIASALERALAEAKRENRKLTLELGAERMGVASRAGTLDLEVELKETKRHRDSLSSENERLKAELEGHAFDLSPAMVQLKTTAPDLAHAIPEMAGGTSDGPPSGAVTFCCPLCGEPDFDKIGLRLHFARLACSQLKNGSAIDLSHIEEIENRHHRDLAATRQKLAEAQADCAAKEVRLLNLIEEAGKELERLRAEKEQITRRAAELISHVCDEHLQEVLSEPFEEFCSKLVCERCLRAQRDQAVALARELGERLQEECNIDDRTGKPRWSNTRDALAKLQSLNPPTGDDTLKV